MDSIILNPPEQKQEKSAERSLAALRSIFLQMQELIAPAVDTRPFCLSLGMGRREMCTQEDGNELLKKIVDQVDNAFKGAIDAA